MANTTTKIAGKEYHVFDENGKLVNLDIGLKSQFASAALNGLLASGTYTKYEQNIGSITRQAWMFAEEMMKYIDQ